jgi:cytolysin-activating lysine-acyltransferase
MVFHACDPVRAIPNFSLRPVTTTGARRSEKFRSSGITKEGLEQMPLGVAIWAKLSEAAQAKLEKGERLTTEAWRSGDRVWLVELISPFAGKDNKITEAMLLDLMQGPFRDTAFNLHRTNAATGRRDKIQMASHVGKMPPGAMNRQLMCSGEE